MSPGKIEKATYVLVIELEEVQEVEVGALGKIEFQEGFYSYTGSAFGPGGVSRIQNHLKLSAGEKQRKRWHIDYLTSNSCSSIRKIFLTPEKQECSIASCISSEGIDGFGCSDCGCNAHLHYLGSGESIEKVRKCFDKKTGSFKEFESENYRK